MNFIFRLQLQGAQILGLILGSIGAFNMMGKGGCPEGANLFAFVSYHSYINVHIWKEQFRDTVIFFWCDNQVRPGSELLVIQKS